MTHTHLSERSLVFVDVETTGLDPAHHEIIEIAFIRESKSGESLRFETKIKPEFIERAHPKALQVNGYTEEKWQGAPPFSEHAEFIAESLSDCLLVGHNVSFDVAFIQDALRRCGVKHQISYHKLDTVTLAYEHLVPLGLGSLSLVNIGKFLGLPVEGAHTAMFDTERCRQVYKLLVGSDPYAWRKWVEAGRPSLEDRVAELWETRMEMDDLLGLDVLVEEAQALERAAQIRDLVEHLVQAREDYYNGTPSMTDAEYDALEDQLRALDPDNVLLKRVGAPVTDSPWEKVQHRAPMGSLNKAQNEGELSTWYKKCLAVVGPQDAGLVISDKCDGISIALYYRDGQLDQAATRGDGEVGEDITRNVIKMKGIVPFIKGFEGFIRGEIVLRKSDWQEHLPTYANPRNAASGIAKRLDGMGSEHLTVLHYQMIRFSGKRIPSKSTEFQLLEKLGAAVPSWCQATTLKHAQEVYQAYLDGQREALDYDIDGLVLEFDDPGSMEQLGQTNLRPKGAVAFKFPHAQEATALRDKRVQVGNTGRVTPVACFDTVSLAGVKVSNASLHNYSNIIRLLREAGIVDRDYLCVGDVLLISRRNDVIPYPEKVLAAAPAGSTPLLMPDECPECGTSLIREGEYLICPNDAGCPAQVAGLVKTWVKKIGLKGWGDTLINCLCEQGLVSDPADLYVLDAGELAEVRMDGRRVGSTATTILKELHSKKELPLHILVGSLNIPLCSRSTCKTIVDVGYDTLDKMYAASVADLAAIRGMGSGRAEAFVEGLQNRKSLIERLLANGVVIQAISEGPLKGKAVCMTGFRDPDMAAAIEAAGGTVKSGVSKNLSVLVAADPKSNSGKAKKARGYGVEIVSPDEMWERLGGRV